MNKTKRSEIKKKALEMWEWVRDRQKVYCEKKGWIAEYTDDFNFVEERTKNAWYLVAEWHLLNGGK